MTEMMISGCAAGARHVGFFHVSSRVPDKVILQSNLCTLSGTQCADTLALSSTHCLSHSLSAFSSALHPTPTFLPYSIRRSLYGHAYLLV